MNLDSFGLNKKASNTDLISNTALKNIIDQELPISKNLCSKSFLDYLDELKKSCQTDIFIKRSSGTKMFHKVLKSSNIHVYIEWFNRLSLLVCSEIVKNTESKEKRTELIDFYINVAYECFNMGNFNSTMAIIGKKAK